MKIDFFLESDVDNEIIELVKQAVEDELDNCKCLNNEEDPSDSHGIITVETTDDSLDGEDLANLIEETLEMVEDVDISHWEIKS